MSNFAVKKRVVRLFFVLMLVFVMVLGMVSCSATEEDVLDPKNPVTITLWHYYSGNNHEMINAAIDEFNQTTGMEKGIVVDPIRMTNIAELETEAEKSAKGVVNSLPMPHIFSCYPDVAFKIDALGQLIDIQEYFTQEELDSYVADFLDDGYFSGERLLLVPIAKSTELLYVNDTAWQGFAKDYDYDYDDLATWESIASVSKDFFEWTVEREGQKNGKEEPCWGTILWPTLS